MSAITLSLLAACKEATPANDAEPEVAVNSTPANEASSAQSIPATTMGGSAFLSL
jgi:hypothetical protein